MYCKGLRAGDAVDVGAAARESPGEQILQLISWRVEWRKNKGRAFGAHVRKWGYLVPAIFPRIALRRFQLGVVDPTASCHVRRCSLALLR